MFKLKLPSFATIVVVYDFPFCARSEFNSLRVIFVPVTNGPFCALPLSVEIFNLSLSQDVNNNPRITTNNKMLIFSYSDMFFVVC